MTDYDIEPNIMNQSKRNYSKRHKGKATTAAHTAAFKLGGLFDILALFSISRVNL